MSSSIISVKCHDDKCSAIAFDESSNNVITVDFNGKANVWSALTDKCIKSYTLSDSVNSMVYEKDRIFISTSSNLIESYPTHGTGNVAVLAQFLAEVNHMRLSKDKSCFVACSSDNSAKVIQLSLADGNESREIVLIGHLGPVISVDIDADCTLVATASCDGSVIIWRARDGANITELPILDQVKDISQLTNHCRLRFSPSSDPILAVPVKDEISLLDCDDWSVRGSLVCDQPITECIFTDDGCFLVTGTSKGNILVWDIKTLSLVNSWSSSRGSAVTGMLWYPKKEKTLLFSDASGYWEAVKIDLKKKEKGKDSLSMEDMDAMFEDFDEEDFEENVDLDADRRSSASTVKRTSEDGSDAEDEFNLSMIKAEFEKKEEAVEMAAPAVLAQTRVDPRRTIHPPVRPGATPVADGLQLMLWNSIGALKKHYDEDGNTGFLEVYFHDCNRYRSIIVKPDTIDCDMGDVNSTALLLVSDPDNDEDDMEEETEKQAMVHVQSINSSWPTWKTLLPVGESPIACCLAGEEYAIVVTNKGLLRYFSLKICGMQSYVESIHGTPVTIASSCVDPEREDQRSRVIVVIDDGERLMWRLEELGPGRFIDRGKVVGSVSSDWHPLPLTRESRLVWIGFSDAGAVYTVDSKQCVRRLQISLSTNGQFTMPRWSPVLNLKQALDKDSRNIDRYFPVGFTDQRGNAGALALHCRCARFPALVPWPHLTVVPFKAALCAGPEELLALEGSLTMLHTTQDWSQDQETLILDENALLLKLFFNSVTQSSDVRSLAIAKLMPDSSVVQVAIRAAARLRKTNLAEKLGQLALSLDEEVESRQMDAEEYDKESEDKENNKEDREEREESEDDKEEEGDKSVEDASTDGDSVLRSMTSVLTEDRAMDSAIKEVDKEKTMESPFRVSKRPATVGRGITVVDKLGLTAKKCVSPKKNSTVFGNFVPSPSVKTFTIKSKRKSTTVNSSPIFKKLKK